MAPPEPADQVRLIRALAAPAGFARHHFGFDPYPYQVEVMDAILRGGTLRLAWEAGRRVGKTTTIAQVALQRAVKLRGTRTAVFAPTLAQASLTIQKARQQLTGSAFEALLAKDTPGELRFDFGRDDRGKRVESVIRANSIHANVRGEGADMLVLDESAQCDAATYESVVRPFTLGHQDAVIIHISTPYTKDDLFAKTKEAFSGHPRGKVLTTRTADRPGVTAEELQELRDAMTEEDFLRECECTLGEGAGVFDRRALLRCLREYPLAGLEQLDQLEPQRHARHFMGVDWGKKRDRTVIAVVRQGTQERRNPARLVFLHVCEPDPKNPTHYLGMTRTVVRVARRLQAERVTVDEAEGAAQVEELQKALGRAVVAPYRFTLESRNYLVEHARMLVEDAAVELPVDPEEVRRAFLNVERAEKGYDHRVGKLKDVFDAIALALLPVEDRGVAEERGPLRARAVEPGGRAVGLRGPEPPRLGDPRKAWLPREAWRYLEAGGERR